MRGERNLVCWFPQGEGANYKGHCLCNHSTKKAREQKSDGLGGPMDKLRKAHISNAILNLCEGIGKVGYAAV
jgi:hypothetical protein